MPRTNPYPGGRSLVPGEEALLIGRDEDIRGFVSAAANWPVLAMLGPSGVGKSSLIGAGLAGRRFRKETGITVCRFSSWGSEPGQSVHHWYAATLAQALEDLARAVEVDDGHSPDDVVPGFLRVDTSAPDFDPVAYVADVQRHFKDTFVVVFDQFEELLRDDPGLGQRFLNKVCSVATEFPAGYCQVISMREELQSSLSRAWRKARFNPSQKHEIFISEIAPEFIEEVVNRPLRLYNDEQARLGLPAVRMNGDAREALLDDWNTARRVSDDLAEAVRSGAGVDATLDERGVGLLQMQAYLHHQFGLSEEGDLFSASESEQSDYGAVQSSSPDGARQKFEDALLGFVKVAMDAEETAAARSLPERDGRRRVANEVLWVTAALPEYLSSGGYKTINSTDELASQVLPMVAEVFRTESREQPADGASTHPEGTPWIDDEPDEVERLDVLVEALACSVRRVADREVHLQHPELSLDELLDEVVKDVLGRFPGLAGWNDPDDGDELVRYGRSVHGLTPLQAACIPVLRFEQGLVWLRRAGLVRLRGSDQGRVVSIVHDGFGQALKRWASDVRSRPEVAISSPMPMSGRQVLDEPVASAPLTQDDLGATDWLGWIACNVRASFTGVTFEDCDLRSTLFRGCTFENVTFRNCLTHGLLFMDCRFVGTTVFVASESADAASAVSEMKTLSFGGGCSVDPGGELVIEGFGGYGLFLDGFTGDWRIERCTFSHMRVDPTPAEPGGRARHQGSFVGSPSVTHVFVDPAWEVTVDVPWRSPETIDVCRREP